MGVSSPKPDTEPKRSGVPSASARRPQQGVSLYCPQSSSAGCLSTVSGYVWQWAAELNLRPECGASPLMALPTSSCNDSSLRVRAASLSSTVRLAMAMAAAGCAEPLPSSLELLEQQPSVASPLQPQQSVQLTVSATRSSASNVAPPARDRPTSVRMPITLRFTEKWRSNSRAGGRRNASRSCGPSGIRARTEESPLISERGVVLTHRSTAGPKGASECPEQGGDGCACGGEGARRYSESVRALLRVR